MFFRFIGRIFFYAYVLPAVSRPILRVLNATLRDWTDKEYAKLSPKDIRRTDSAGFPLPYHFRHHFMPSPGESAGNHNCRRCGATYLNPIHKV